MTKLPAKSDIVTYLVSSNIDGRSGRTTAAAGVHRVRRGRSEDGWDQRWRTGVLRRARQSWRRSAFTPLKVHGCPGRGRAIDSERFAERVARCGLSFSVARMWDSHSRSHPLLPFEWKDNPRVLPEGDPAVDCQTSTNNLIELQVRNGKEVQRLRDTPATYPCTPADPARRPIGTSTQTSKPDGGG